MRRCILLVVMFVVFSVNWCMAFDLNYYPPEYDPYETPYPGQPFEIEDIDLVELKSAYDTNIGLDNIVDAVFDGSYRYAWGLTTDYIKQEILDQFYTEKGIASLVSHAGSKLEDILNGSKSPAEKAIEIFETVNVDFGDYESDRTGQLGMSLQYSPLFGVSKLEWDNVAEVTQCKEWMTGLDCEWDSNGVMHCTPYAYYKIHYLHQLPDYYIYRVVDGQSELVTKVKGARKTTRNLNIDTKHIGQSLLSLWNYYDSDFEYVFKGDRVSFFDWDADLRHGGSTLSYQVVSKVGPYKEGNCGSSSVKTSVSVADGDGDGYVDFVPVDEYSKYPTEWWSGTYRNTLTKANLPPERPISIIVHFNDGRADTFDVRTATIYDYDFDYDLSVNASGTFYYANFVGDLFNLIEILKPVVSFPSSLTVPSTDMDGNYTVSWGASVTPGVTYRLEEATDSGFTAGLRTVVSGTSTLSAQITGRTDKQRYFYRVRAEGSDGNSPWQGGMPYSSANKSCFIGSPPVVPGTIVVPAMSSTGAYTVSWGASPTPGVIYELQEATNSSFTAGLRTVFPADSSLSRDFVGQESGVTYYYRVRAEIGGMYSGWRTGANGCAMLVDCDEVYSGAPSCSIEGAAPNSRPVIVRVEIGNEDWSYVYTEDHQSTLADGFFVEVDGTSLELDDVACEMTKVEICEAASLVPNMPPYMLVPQTSATGNYTVSWGASSTGGVTYELQEATNSSFTAGLKTIGPSDSSLSRAITGRQSGVTYYYRVRAQAGGLSSDWRAGSYGCAVNSCTTLVYSGVHRCVVDGTIPSTRPVTIRIEDSYGVWTHTFTQSSQETYDEPFWVEVDFTNISVEDDECNMTRVEACM